MAPIQYIVEGGRRLKGAIEPSGNKNAALPIIAAALLTEHPVTLDTNERSLLQVRVKEVDEADDIFTKLMGDVVEPRREFIQDNSLSANVDV